MQGFASNINVRGFSIVPEFFSARDVDQMLTYLASVQDNGAVRRRGGIYAVRNLLEIVPAIEELITSPQLQVMVQSVLGRNAVPVRGLLFDKTPEANWLVPWHQDLTICVKERIDVPGYGPWTQKAGVCHVQPPVAVLDSMLAVRLHLDDCHESNGALRVLPGTHRRGRLTAEEIEHQQALIPPVTCSVDRGGVILMKPMLLHAASAASRPFHRRIIHIEYASCELAGGLQWFTARQEWQTVAG